MNGASATDSIDSIIDAFKLVDTDPPGGIRAWLDAI